ncbi:MAG: UDP-3-O-(3-hydroxymyristoyl)glucosamine N-acyltransferase [Candidatus Eisenbacteria sp.]|nr:UDP-3-O-(3-hydroxymyristoyl)glucosamine N-acyltransferase [Candidatus Eisenbacteria bacterium]
MVVTLGEIAERIGGELVGSGSIEIRGVSGIREAEEGDVTFLANPRYEGYLRTTRASAVIMSRNSFQPSSPVIYDDNPYLAFLKVVKIFFPDRGNFPDGIHPKAVIGENVRLGKAVAIGAHVVVGDGAEIGDRAVLLAGCYVGDRTRIGDDTLIYPNVSVREDVSIGKRVIIHCGAVVGSDGFGFAKDGDEYQKVPQVGNVVVADDVEIGANVCIDRSTTGTTRIGRGTKIDNLVQIGHNVVIGENSIIVAQVGISGSTEIGNNVTLAGQSGVVGHIKIGDNAVVGAQAGVTKSVSPGTCVSGYPARPHAQSARINATMQRLPELLQKLRELERRVLELEGGRGESDDK